MPKSPKPSAGPAAASKPARAPKTKAPNSKASKPELQPLGPALAELLNPAINRGTAGLGSGTGPNAGFAEAPQAAFKAEATLPTRPSPTASASASNRPRPSTSRRRSASPASPPRSRRWSG